MSGPKVQPALLGGVAIGVLSALPLLNIANCCCAWIIFGGALSAYLLQQNQPHARISLGDGAIVGLLAGLVGTLVWVVVSVPLNLAIAPFQSELMRRAMENTGDLPPAAREVIGSLQGGAAMGLAWFAGFVVMLCVSAIFGMVGGVFGALLFAKEPPTPPPPPPPVFVPPTYPPPIPGGEGPTDPRL